jgi:hypothetical protein
MVAITADFMMISRAFPNVLATHRYVPLSLEASFLIEPSYPNPGAMFFH